MPAWLVRVHQKKDVSNRTSSPRPFRQLSQETKSTLPMLLKGVFMLSEMREYEILYLWLVRLADVIS
jgi:hypothetical protein